MSSYRLQYFNIRGRAEPARWIFAYTKEPYADDRFDRGEKWEKFKSDTPYGKVPILFVDGKPLCTSVAICRYLGKVHGLCPEDPLRQAICDEVADVVSDLVTPAGKIVYAKIAKNEEEVKSLSEDFRRNMFPAVGRGLELRLADSEYFGGDKIAWVDLFAVCYVSQLAAIIPDFLETTPKLKNLVEKVLALPEIAKWIKERPQTLM